MLNDVMIVCNLQKTIMEKSAWKWIWASLSPSDRNFRLIILCGILIEKIFKN